MRGLYLFVVVIFALKSTLYGKSIANPNSNELLRIPVSFHIVHKSFGENEISMKKLETLIAKINKGFNQVDLQQIDIQYRDIVANCNIEFYLPVDVYDANCNKKSPITYHSTPKNHFDYYETSYSNNLPYDHELKENGYVDSNSYLNIWVADLDDKGLGYSTSPKETNDRNDGIVLSSDLFVRYDNNTNSTFESNLDFTALVTTHEIGHWLGLYHIWGKRGVNQIDLFNGVIPININGCLSSFYSDDEIEDTPRQSRPNVINFNNENSSKMIKVCGSSTQLSNYQNFMDYAFNVGMFTKGQKAKMRFSILEYRAGIISVNNCNNIERNSEFDNAARMSKLEFNTYVLSTLELDFRNNHKYLSDYLNKYKNRKHNMQRIGSNPLNWAIDEIENYSRNFDLSKVYVESKRYMVPLFSDEKFQFKFTNVIYNQDIYTIFRSFKSFRNSRSNYGYFGVYAINRNELVQEITLSKESKIIKGKRIYYDVYYSLLDIPLMNEGFVDGMMGYIEFIRIYSDKERQNLVKIIYPNTPKSYYLNYDISMIDSSNMINHDAQFKLLKNE